MTKTSRLFLGKHDHLDGLLSKPLEHCSGRQLFNPTYQG
ncbi:hypothetical protein SynBIOSU31_01157 [Synechococcus sp. BIOS-U3-1]|nr:hypothetical protein SynBIOSU31_01157 [Synechococcus sp. BIOS-U3-1]